MKNLVLLAILCFEQTLAAGRRYWRAILMKGYFGSVYRRSRRGIFWS